MAMRATVVLLVVLNLGIAVWWIARPAPAPRVLVQPAGVPTLQLAPIERPQAVAATTARPGAAGDGGAGADGAGPSDEAAAVRDAPATPGAVASALPEPAAPAAPVAPTPLPADAPQPRCFTAGPFDGAAALARARERLAAGGATILRTREATTAPRGWRVQLPPLADRAAAEAVAERIRIAGFDDYLIVPAGEDAHAIALGRYGSESAARRRESELREAGFAARAEPVGAATTRAWLDLRAGADSDVAGLAPVACDATR